MTTSSRLAYPSVFLEQFMDEVTASLNKVSIQEVGLVSGWLGGKAFLTLISHPRFDSDVEFSRHTVMVRNLYVSPTHRNKGVAANALKTLMGLAADNGITLWGDCKPYSLISGSIETAEDYNLEFHDEQIGSWKAALKRIGWQDASDKTMPNALIYRPEGCYK